MVSLSQCQKENDNYMSEEELGDWPKMEEKTESQNATTTLWSLRRDRWAWENSDYHNHIHMFSEVFETSLTSWNSFHVRFAIILTPWLTVLKAHATPTNINAHVSRVGWKVIEMHARHTLWICTPSSTLQVTDILVHKY